MARCSHCGTVNREGAVFCQSCGQRIEEAKPKPAAPVAAGGPTCPSCQTVNAPGMNFCKMCGSNLAAVAAPEPVKLTCTACGKQTPSGFAFCQHCGHRVSAPPGVASPVGASPGVAAGPTTGSNPTAGVGPIGAAKSQAVAATMMAEAPFVAPTPPAGMPRPSDAFAATMGPGAVAPFLEGKLPMSTVKTSPVRPEDLKPERVYATLVVVRRDGSDGESVRVTEQTFDVGRTEGGLTFADDVYLAARHVRVSFQNGHAIVRSLDATNGVYVRLRGAVDLSPGDHFLVGKELIRYEQVGAEERDVNVVEHGVRLFGTVPRDAWARLRQISAAGTTRDVWHISRPDLVLGREEGDVTFPDDEFMSRRHAAVRRGTPKAKLEDLSSSNGTFIRIRGDHPVKSGDLLRLGDQLLRVEL